MLRLPLILLLAAFCVLPGCGSADDEPEPLRPYRRYFEAMRPEASYVFATLAAKQQFDREPGSMGFREYVSNTGLRVLIHVPQMRGAPKAEGPVEAAETETDKLYGNEPGEILDPAAAPGEPQLDPEAEELVERIALGFEREEETTLTLRSDPTAPPVDYVRPSLAPGSGPIEVAEELPTSRPDFMSGRTEPTPRDDSEPPAPEEVLPDIVPPATRPVDAPNPLGGSNPSTTRPS